MTPKQYNARALRKFGTALERFREEKNLSRAQLAEKADMHYDSLLRLERGERKPNLSTAVELANALGLRVTQLLEV